MEFREIQSNLELIDNLKKDGRAYVLLYKSGSELSQCAIQQINEASGGKEEIQLFKADVSVVRDIHPNYPVTTVPSLLSFEKGEFVNVIKGCNDVNYYRALFDNIVYHAKEGEKAPQKRVTVYSTPNCSWCTTLKSYLKKNTIQFWDVDVSKDQKRAEEMVRKSGQQGVPQTDINGQIVVGFNQARINELLEIEG